MEDENKEITGAVIEGIPNMSSSQDYMWKKLVVLLTDMHEPVPALQQNCDTSWILVGCGTAVTLCPPTLAQEVPIIRGPET